MNNLGGIQFITQLNVITWHIANVVKRLELVMLVICSTCGLILANAWYTSSLLYHAYLFIGLQHIKGTFRICRLQNTGIFRGPSESLLSISHLLLFGGLVRVFRCSSHVTNSILLYICSIILETDANVIAGKVANHTMDAGAPFSEQVCNSGSH